MKTWLQINRNNDVYRHNEYGDEPDLIGSIEGELDGNGWFMIRGDNRTLNVEELQQILDFL